MTEEPTCALCSRVPATHTAIALHHPASAQVCQGCFMELYPHGPEQIDEAHLRTVWVAKTWEREQFERAWQRLSAEDRARVLAALDLLDEQGQEEDTR